MHVHSCERCGAELDYTQGHVVLVGGVQARLCKPCLNEHCVALFRSPAWADHQRSLAEEHHLKARSSAGDPPSVEEFLASFHRDTEANLGLHEFGRTFIRPIDGGRPAE